MEVGGGGDLRPRSTALLPFSGGFYVFRHYYRYFLLHTVSSIWYCSVTTVYVIPAPFPRGGSHSTKRLQMIEDT